MSEWKAFLWAITICLLVLWISTCFGSLCDPNWPDDPYSREWPALIVQADPIQRIVMGNCIEYLLEQEMNDPNLPDIIIDDEGKAYHLDRDLRDWNYVGDDLAIQALYNDATPGFCDMGDLINMSGQWLLSVNYSIKESFYSENPLTTTEFCGYGVIRKKTTNTISTSATYEGRKCQYDFVDFVDADGRPNPDTTVNYEDFLLISRNWLSQWKGNE